MEYIAKWLQKAYAQLFTEYENRPFKFDDVRRCLSTSQSTALNIISYLNRAGWLFVFGYEKRKRIYRLLNPADIFFSLNKLQNLEKIKQKRYLPLIIKTCRYLWVNYREYLTALTLYGSVSRGNAGATSDVDLFVVISDNEREKTLSERLDTLYNHIELIEPERNYLRKNQIWTDVSFYPLTTSEASRLLPIYLDIAHEGIILLDTNSYFQDLMKRVLSQLKAYGVKKVTLDDMWYWKLGKEFEIKAIEHET